jgi:hypothetical protein
MKERSALSKGRAGRFGVAGNEPIAELFENLKVASDHLGYSIHRDRRERGASSQNASPTTPALTGNGERNEPIAEPSIFKEVTPNDPAK